MLTRLGFETAALDAKLLAGHGLSFNALELATRENERVSPDAAARVADLLQRRMSGESVARIIGHREFYGLDFALNAATLEPRPDTELLVDLAIKTLPQSGQLLDLGTGSGCIPIAILVNRADARAMATDLAEEALAVASANARQHQVDDRLRFKQGSWLEAVPADERFDLIVSNPPYIATSVIATLATEVRAFDPMLALDGGPDGLTPYRIIARDAAAFLKPRGQLMVEIGYDQGLAVSTLLAEAGFTNIAVHKDLGGLDRVVAAHHMGSRTAS